jgi:hypothetical protein
MALNLSVIRKPVNRQALDPSTGIIREDWLLFLNQLADQHNAAVEELSTDPAPKDAQYIVGAANSTLTAERVATDTTTVDVDMGTAGQAKFNVLEVPGIAAAGVVARTAAATYAARTITGPAAGISVSNGDGVSGNPTLALANDLAALEALGSTGMVARTASETYALRTITAGANISVSNGDGVSGNPTIAFSGSITPTLGRRAISDITSGDTIVAADNAKLVNIATGTGTLAFTAAATLAANFWCIIKNAGTGNITLNPDGSEQVDGKTNWILYPGGTIIVECDGSAFYSVLLSPMLVTYNSSDTFTTPGVGTWIEVDGWGAGGSGGRGATSVAGGGGGGGSCVRGIFLRTALGTTETVTIGAGGAARTTNTAGADGGNSTFGSLLTAYGGGGGQVVPGGVGGSGGGSLSAASGPIPGEPLFDGGGGGVGFGGAAAGDSGASGGNSAMGGAGGGGGDAATGGTGGNSLFGGGGGGGGSDTTGAPAGGTSRFGGNGGAGNTGASNATAGSQPGGGGGGSETGNSGAGGSGRITVRVY